MEQAFSISGRSVFARDSFINCILT